MKYFKYLFVYLYMSLGGGGINILVFIGDIVSIVVYKL